MRSHRRIPASLTRLAGMLALLLLLPASAHAQDRVSLEEMDEKLDDILDALEFLQLSLVFPSTIPLDRFGPDATTIDIDVFPCASGFPSIPGVSVSSSGFHGMTAPPPAPAGCQTWGEADDPGRKTLFFDDLTIDPDDAITRVGFVFGSNVVASVQVNLIRGGLVTASFTVTSDGQPPDGVDNWAFYGFQDVAGIDAVELLPTGTSVGIYDLIFE